MKKMSGPLGGIFLTQTVCDHNSPTLQTDGRTHRQTDDMRSQDRALH